MEGSSDVEGDLVGEVFEYLLSGKYCDGASKERKRTMRKKALKFSVSSRGELFYRQKRKGKACSRGGSRNLGRGGHKKGVGAGGGFARKLLAI